MAAGKRTNIPPRTKVGRGSPLSQGYAAGSGKRRTKLSTSGSNYGLEGSGSKEYQRGYSAGKASMRKSGDKSNVPMTRADMAGTRKTAQAKRAVAKKAARGAEGPKRSTKK